MVLALLLCLRGGMAAAGPPPRDVGRTPPIQVGVLSVLDDQDTGRQWQPLIDALSRALGPRALVLRPLDPLAMERALQAHELGFVITNPGHYVLLESRHGATRIATQTAARGGDPAHAVGSTVVVRADAPLPQGLAGLKGQRVAAVSEQAFGGYQLVAADWVRHGIDAESGDVTRVFTGYPMTRVAEAVLDGSADAGILRTCLLERLEREGRLAAGALRVSRPIPTPTACPARAPRRCTPAGRSRPCPMCRRTWRARWRWPC